MCERESHNDMSELASRQANAFQIFLQQDQRKFRRNQIAFSLPSFIEEEKGVQFIIPDKGRTVIFVNIRESEIQVTVTSMLYNFPLQILPYVEDFVNQVNTRATLGRYMISYHPDPNKSGAWVVLNIPIFYPAEVSWFSNSFMNIMMKISMKYFEDAENYFYPFIKEASNLCSPSIGKSIGTTRKEEIFKEIRDILYFAGFRKPREISVHQLKVAKNKARDDKNPEDIDEPEPLVSLIFPTKAIMSAVSCNELQGYPCNVFPILLESSDFFITIRIIYSEKNDLVTFKENAVSNHLEAVINTINFCLDRGELRLVEESRYLYFELKIPFYGIPLEEIGVLIYDGFSFLVKKFGEIGGIIADVAGGKMVDLREISMQLREQNHSYSKFMLKNPGFIRYKICNPKTSNSKVFEEEDFRKELQVIQMLRSLPGMSYVQFSEAAKMIFYPSWKGKLVKNIITSNESTSLIHNLMKFLEKCYTNGVLFEEIPFDSLCLASSKKFEHFIYSYGRYSEFALIGEFAVEDLEAQKEHWLIQIEQFIFKSINHPDFSPEVDDDWLIALNNFEPNIEEFGMSDDCTLSGVPVEFLHPEFYTADYYSKLCSIRHPFIVSPFGMVYFNSTYYVAIQSYGFVNPCELDNSAKVKLANDLVAAKSFLKMKKIEVPVIVPKNIRIGRNSECKFLLLEDDDTDLDLWRYPGPEEDIRTELYNLGLIMLYIFSGEVPYQELFDTFGKEQVLRDIVEIHRRPLIPWKFEFSHPRECALVRELLYFNVNSIEDLFEKLKNLQEN